MVPDHFFTSNKTEKASYGLGIQTVWGVQKVRGTIFLRARKQKGELWSRTIFSRAIKQKRRVMVWGYKQFGEFKRSGGPFEAGDKSGR